MRLNRPGRRTGCLSPRVVPAPTAWGLPRHAAAVELGPGGGLRSRQSALATSADKHHASRRPGPARVCHHRDRLARLHLAVAFGRLGAFARRPRKKTNFASSLKRIRRSRCLRKKNFVSLLQNMWSNLRHSAPVRGACRDRHEARCGERWTPLCLLTSGTEADGKGMWSWRPRGPAPSWR